MKQGLTFVAIIVLAAAAIWYSLTPINPATGELDRNGQLVALGLDLKGGMRVTMEPDPTKPDASKADAETMRLVRDVLENRVNAFGLAGTEVRLKGDNQVIVVLPGARNPEEALVAISKVAQLEFRYLNNVRSEKNLNGAYRMNVTPGDAAKGEADRYTFTDAETNQGVPAEQVLKEAQLILKGDSLRPTSKATINPNEGRPVVTFELDPQGARIFGDFTTDHVGEILAVVLDNEIISAPTINEPITEGHGQISGSKTMTEARVLSNLLNSGALPVPLRAAETQFVGATLGQESIQKSIMAGLVGLGLVLVFMLAYYWMPGFIACLALIVYAAITFSIYKGVFIFKPIPLDLPGITGFILSVGMAVDANILIFERLKEELRAGKTLHAAIDAGFNRAFSSIFDSNVTTWIVCAILIWLGAPIIKGFAITLAIGVAVSMFTAITVTRTILHLVVNMPWARNEALYGLNVSWLGLFYPPSRRGAILRVFEKRKVYFALSILLAVAALGFTAMTPFGMGLKPGIDFTGGSVVEAAFRDKSVTREQVVQALQQAGLQDATVRIGSSERPWTTVTLEAEDVDEATKERIRERLSTTTGLEAFDADAYQATTEGKAFKVSAQYTGEVTEAQIRGALSASGADSRPLALKGLKVAVNRVDHSGTNAVPIAEITTAVHPQQLQQLQGGKSVKEVLNGIGGGIIGPMYQQSSIGPSVAAEIVRNAFASVVVASLAIVLYLAFRFAIGGFLNGLKFGICAVVALVHDVGITIGLFAIMGFLQDWKVDSLFVTAALTILGFSVHDTIVVYDRIRENLYHRQKGETFADVSDRSITQTFDRSLNTSLTVLLVVAALVLFGGESIRLFNIALLVGIGIGTYSSIFVASPLVVLLEQRLAGRTPQPAAPSGPARARKDDVAMTRRSTPARETAPPAGGTRSTATAAPPVASAAGEDAETRAEETDPNRPAIVRPRKKRRM